MSEEIWYDLQYLVLGRDDPELFIPHGTYTGVLSRNRLSIIGRVLNTREQDLRSVIQVFPRLWGLSSRVHGRILSDQYVQFRFCSEVDLISVLQRAPWMVNDWFVALQRWQDFPDEEFLSSIDLWVQIRGIPLPYVSELTVRFIADTLGPVVTLDFNDETTNQIVFIRVKVRLGITDRFRFFRRVRFETGERAMIGFEYEKMRKICSNCCRINHHSSYCPFLAPQIPDEESEELVVPIWEEGQSSNNNHAEESHHSQSSDISSYSPISQPPKPVSPMLFDEECVEAHHGHKFSSSSTFRHEFSGSSTDNSLKKIGINKLGDLRWITL
ncbi:unnamed protein product [Arabidopsis halleri]